VALVAKDAITKPTHINGMKWIISDKLISKKGAYQVQRGRRKVKQTSQTRHIIIHHITFQTQTMWNSKMMDLPRKEECSSGLCTLFCLLVFFLAKLSMAILFFTRSLCPRIYG